MVKGEIFRFVIVGFINTFNYYALYLLFTVLFSFYYMWSHLIAFIVSMIGSFFLNTYFTYKTKPSLKKFFQFPFTYVVNVTITTSTLYVLVDLLKFNNRIAPLLASLLAIPFTFVVSRKILKQDQGEKDAPHS